MHLDDSSSALLKKLLTAQLTPICDADPIVLADYVIALLKHDKPIADLKTLCVSQLDDFLKDATRPFVANLFESLAAKGYIPAGHSVAPHVADTRLSPPPPSRSPVKEQAAVRQEPDVPPPRKSYEEELSDDEDGDRNFKHTRRGGHDSSTPSEKASPAVDQAGARRGGHRDRTRSDENSARKRARGEEDMYAEPASVHDTSSQHTYPANKVAKHDDHANYGSASSENKRRRSEEPNQDDGDGQRAKIPRGYGGSASSPVVNGGRRDYDRDPRDVRPMNPPRYGPVMSNQTMPPGPNRWEGMSEWGNQGVPSSDRDGRFVERGNGRFRGRMGERPPGRGGMGPTRGGFMNARGRRPCRDYEERGYCLRGDACPFDHGVDRIVVDDLPMVSGRPPFDLMVPGPMPGMRTPFNVPFSGNRPPYDMEPYDPVMQASLAQSSEGYDPERASFASSARSANENGSNGKGENPAVQFAPPNVPGGNVESVRGAFRGRGFGRRGGGRGGYAGQAPQRGDTLAVQNVPNEYLTIDKINDFFKKFGTITNIKLTTGPPGAILQFARHEEALAAYKCPDPIFGNRFVKVFWAQPETPALGESSSATPPVGFASTHRRSVIATDADMAVRAEEGSASNGSGALIDEKKEKAKQMLDMQQSLIEKQLEEQKKIMGKLQSKNLTPKEKKALLDQFEILSKSLKDVMQSASSQVSAVKSKAPSTTKAAVMEEKERERLDRELDAINQIQASGSANGGPDSALVAKLEALKAQATEQGIDPAAVLAAGSSSGRGGSTAFRGRGRGSWSFGNRAPGHFSLDNRPTKIYVKGLVSPAQLALRPHFERFGNVTGLSFLDNETNAIVEFASRRDAEKAISEPLPFVGGDKAELSWYSPEVASVTTAQAPGHIVPAGETTLRSRSPAGLEAPKQWEEEDDEEEDNERSWKRR